MAIDLEKYKLKGNLEKYKLKETPAPEKPVEPGFVQSIFQGIASPFLKTAETARGAIGGTYELGKAGLSKLTGDEAGYQQGLQRAAEISSPTRQADYGYLGKVSPVSTPKEAVGVGAEIGSYLIPAGKAGQVGKQVLERGALETAKDIARPGFVKAFKTALPYGAASGGLSGVGTESQKKESTLGSILTSGGESALTGASTFGLLSGVGSKVSQKILDNRTANITKAAKEFDDLAIKIVQGEPKDIDIAKKALSNIDVSNIKTAQDAVFVVNDKIKTIANKLDEALVTDTTVRPLNTLLKNKHNYVEDSLKQLDDYYTKTNDIPKKQAIEALTNKAKTEGLTVKEINDIAKVHGQDLNAYNASGELASGLKKQAAENTRMGLKDTARDLFGNPAFKAADEEMASLIRVRDLFKDQVIAVNDLQKKILPRTLGEKAGRLISQIVNTLGGNAPKGAIEYFLGRGTGQKTINALEWEKNLQKNLKRLQKLSDPSLSDEQLMKELENITNEIKDQSLLLPEPAIVTPPPIDKSGIIKGYSPFIHKTPLKLPPGQLRLSAPKPIELPAKNKIYKKNADFLNAPYEPPLKSIFKTKK